MSRRANTARHSDERHSTEDFDARQHFDAEIVRFQRMLEEKENMLQTAADIGGQLLKQNEELQQRLRDLEESKRRNQYEIKQLQRQNDIVRVAHEDAQAEIRQLRDSLLERKEEIENLEQTLQFRQTLSPSPRVKHQRDSFDDTEVMASLEQISKERDLLAAVVQEERMKSNELTRKAEELQYELNSAQRNNAQLEQELEAMNDEFTTLQGDYEHEIARLSEECEATKAEVQLLTAQVDDQQHQLSFVHEPETQRFSDVVGGYDFNLGEELVLDQTASLDLDINEAQPPAVESVSLDIQLPTNEEPEVQPETQPEPRTADLASEALAELPPHPQRVKTLAKMNRQKSKRRRSTIRSTNNPHVDALEEFIHLTVTAAKINFADVPVSSQHLLSKVRTEKLPFHQVAGWLDKYLTNKRSAFKKHGDEASSEVPSRAPSAEAPSPVKETVSTYGYLKQLFGRNKRSTGEDNRQIKLQVRYDKRMFEVRMKRKDTLQTLAYTLPRFLHDKPTDIVFFHKDRQLDIDETIDENKLMSHDSIRMLERRAIPEYLKKYKKRLAKVAKTRSQQYATARDSSVDASEVSLGDVDETMRRKPPPPLRKIDGRYRKFELSTLNGGLLESDDESDMIALQVETIDLTSDLAKIAQNALLERETPHVSSSSLASFDIAKRIGVVLGVGVFVIYSSRVVFQNRSRILRPLR